MKRELIYTAVRKFNSLGQECSLELSDKLGISDLQISQVHYLKIIDRTVEDMTFSRFAEILNVTKPSVTEIINKLKKLECVSKKRCSKDKRIFYIELTEKGRNIARISYLAEQKLVDRIFNTFDDEEISIFINLIKKL